jgi:hypothetical protein
MDDDKSSLQHIKRLHRRYENRKGIVKRIDQEFLFLSSLDRECLLLFLLFFSFFSKKYMVLTRRDENCRRGRGIVKLICRK